MSEIKLLPCPFCGSEKLKIDKKSTLVGYNGLDERVERWTYSVRCSSCHARGGTVGGKVIPFKYADVERKDITTKEELKAKCVEAWNTRKPIEDMVEQLDKACFSPEGDYPGFVIDAEQAVDIVRGGRE